jgi:hypothetical protein
VIGFAGTSAGFAACVVDAGVASTSAGAGVGFDEVGLLLEATGLAEEGFSTGAATTTGGVTGYVTTGAACSTGAAEEVVVGLLNQEGTVETGAATVECSSFFTSSCT